MPRKAQIESVAAADGAPGGAAAVDRALSLLAAFRTGDTSLSAGRAGRSAPGSTRARCCACWPRWSTRGWCSGWRTARYSAGQRGGAAAARSTPPRSRWSAWCCRCCVNWSRTTGESAAYHVRQGQARRVAVPVPRRLAAPGPRPHPAPAICCRWTAAPVGACSRRSIRREPKSGSAADRKLLAGVRERGYCAATGDRLAEVAGISAPVLACRRNPRRRRHADHAQPSLSRALCEAGAGGGAAAQRPGIGRHQRAGLRRPAAQQAQSRGLTKFSSQIPRSPST